MVGLADRIEHYPSELSGGQQQRVAIARAIITDPTILVADEPTGDLDRVSADDILGLMDQLNSELGKTIIMVTHDARAAEAAHHLMHLEKGVFADIGNRASIDAMPSSLALRNAFRHELRTALTMLGLVIAVLAFGLLQTVVDAWYAGRKAPRPLGLSRATPSRWCFRCRSLTRTRSATCPASTASAMANWFGGIYIDKTELFPQFAVDAKSYFELYPEYHLRARAAEGVPAGPQRLRGRPQARADLRLEAGRRGAVAGHDLPGQLGVRGARHLRRGGERRPIRASSFFTGTISTRR